MPSNASVAGSGTPCANTAMHPFGHSWFGAAEVLPASGRKTSPLTGSTEIECGFDKFDTPSGPNSTDCSRRSDVSLITSKTRTPEVFAPVTKKSPNPVSNQISSVLLIWEKRLTIEPMCVTGSMCKRTAWPEPQPTKRLPLVPSARPVDPHVAGPPAIDANLVNAPTVPSVLISAMPPWSPPNDGTEMKKLPVFGSHTDCSRPSAGPAPGITMGEWAMETGMEPLVV